MATRGHWRPRFCAAASPSRSRAGQGPDRDGVGVGGAGAGGLMTQVRQLRPPARGKGRSRGLASCALPPPTSGALAPPAPHHRQKGRGQSPGLNQRTRESWTGLILAQRARLVLINMPGGRRLAGTARALGLCWTGARCGLRGPRPGVLACSVFQARPRVLAGAQGGGENPL